MLGASSALQDVKNNLQQCTERTRGRKLTAHEDGDSISKLLISLLRILRFGLQPGESFLRFFQAAAKEIPRTPEIHDVLENVLSTSDATISSMSMIDREPVFLLFSLQAPGSLMRTSQRFFRLTTVMHSFYFPDAPFFSESFVAQELQPVLLKLARLPLNPPSVEEGLRALHLFHLQESGVPPAASASSASPQPLAAVQSAKPKQATLLPSDGDVQGQTSSSNTTARDSLTSVEDDKVSIACVAASTTPANRPLPVSVVFKKKKKPKQAVDVSMQTVEPADAVSLVRSVGIAVSPQCSHAAVQTILRERGGPASPDRPSQMLSSMSWEAALAAREVELLARERDLDERERVLREREHLLLGIESSAAKRPGSAWQATRFSASPRNSNGRCLSNAIRSVVEGSASPPRSARRLQVESSHTSPRPRVPPAQDNVACMRATPLPSNNPVGPSLNSEVAPTDAGPNLAPLFLWTVRSQLRTGSVTADEQGHVCAQCGVPVERETPCRSTEPQTDEDSSSSSTPLRLQDFIPRRNGSSTVVSRVVASATQWKQQLELKLASSSPSRRSDSDEANARGNKSTTKPPHEHSSQSPPPSAVASTTPASVVDTSGFRVCHYTGSVFCANCLPDGCVFVLPAQIVFHWDFGLYPVCAEAQHVIRKNMSSPVVHINALENLLKKEHSVAVVEAARGLRRQLRILHSVMATCTDVRSSVELSRIVYSRHSAVNEVYSLRDLVELNGLVLASVEAKRSSASALATTTTIRTMTLDETKDALLERLKKMRDTAVVHCVRECDSCKANATKSCGLCSDSTPLFIFDTKNVAVCDACRALYHKSCWHVAEQRCNSCATAALRGGRSPQH